MYPNDVKVEICVDSIASALAAFEGGASRIELCSALEEGGLTPTVGVLKTLKASLGIPIFCMLRPRRGNFFYSDLDFNAILTDMEILLNHGSDGFVFGALTWDNKIDVEKCHRVVQMAAGRPVTFHRAFDTTNPNIMHETVDQIRRIGFKRILSSGFRNTAIEGSENLASLIAKHHKDIIIMPGAGITTSNLDALLTITKCIEVHSSGKRSNNSKNVANVTHNEVVMGKQDTGPYEGTDTHIVREMMSIVRGAMEC